MQVKYKEGGKKEAGPALYHLLPETAETQRAKHMSEIQSEVLAPPPNAPPTPSNRLRLTVLTLTLSDAVPEGEGGAGRLALLSDARHATDQLRQGDGRDSQPGGQRSLLIGRDWNCFERCP